MPFEMNKTSPIKLGSLRPMPLSYHSVAGNCWVLREDDTPCRISDLAVSSQCTKHRLLGPDGVVEVNIQIGAFQDSIQATTMRVKDGAVVTFLTTLPFLRLDANRGHTMTEGCIYLALQMNNGVREFVEVQVIELHRPKAIEHYSYSLSPCAIYLGAGRKPVFLPFEVT